MNVNIPKCDGCGAFNTDDAKNWVTIPRTQYHFCPSCAGKTLATIITTIEEKIEAARPKPIQRPKPMAAPIPTPTPAA